MSAEGGRSGRGKCGQGREMPPGSAGGLQAAGFLSLHKHARLGGCGETVKSSHFAKKKYSVACAWRPPGVHGHDTFA